MSSEETTLAARHQRILELFTEAFPDADLAVREIPEHDVMITLPAAHLRRAVQILMDDVDIVHLSTITGDDTGEEIRLLYHFWRGAGITLEVKLPLDDPRVATLTDLIPGATFYEREVAEMFGVEVEGHPDLRPLLLPDDWDQGAPLRRDFELAPGGEA
jgi:NADH:ubiquinone oxidoreductase subunit C